MLVAVVDLVDQEGVVDAQHLVLQQRSVHLLVFFLCWVLLLLTLTTINLSAVPPLFHLDVFLVDCEELDLGAEDGGCVVGVGALADESIPLGRPLRGLVHAREILFVIF